MRYIVEDAGAAALIVQDDPADELIAWSKDKIAGYKRPRGAAIISEEEMPRTVTGKIQHHVLRERFGLRSRS